MASILTQNIVTATVAAQPNTGTARELAKTTPPREIDIVKSSDVAPTQDIHASDFYWMQRQGIVS